MSFAEFIFALYTLFGVESKLEVLDGNFSIDVRSLSFDIDRRTVGESVFNVNDGFTTAVTVDGGKFRKQCTMVEARCRLIDG
jgi:hypothetical protein